MSERPEMRLIRESLESVLSPNIAASVLFDALEHSGGKLPDSDSAVIAFLRGPLREGLIQRLGTSDSQPVLEELEMTLSTLQMLAPRAPSRPREGEVTREVVVDALPVIVAVVSSSEDFADKLTASLGDACVVPISSATLKKLADDLRITPPKMVLIDGADFAEIEPVDLAAVLRTLPVSTVRAIWGADLPYGIAVLRALAEQRIPATPFDRSEGIAPLLDLIRSRRAG